MIRISVKDAAVLAKASYAPSGIRNPDILNACPDDDVQAYFLSNGILLLPGSNSVKDYLRFNLRLLNLGNARLKLHDDATEKGASGTTWHQGFLSYSRVIFDWLNAIDREPNFIIGHSLGAAAAQILCRSYGCPTVAFAAPRPKHVNGHVKHDEKLLIINRSDDLVPSLPPSFSHMGRAISVTPTKRRIFPAHSMKRYIEVIKPAGSSTRLPSHWG